MTTDEIQLELMTWPEVRDAVDAGHTTAVFACGAVEQHGPHLPLFMDAEHGTRLSLEVARRLGRALVAPTIRVGCSDHHLDFAGTLSIRRSTFEAICTDYCTSLAHHGFRRICIIPSHGGNFDPLAGMLERLNDAVAPDAEVFAYTELMQLLELWREAIDELAPGRGARVGGHADIAEASIMLAMHPERPRMDRAEPGYLGEISQEFFHRVVRDGFRTVTPNGILGDPRGASAELGEACIRVLADAVADHFRQAVAAGG